MQTEQRRSDPAGGTGQGCEACVNRSVRTRNVHRGAVRRVEAEIAGLGRTKFLEVLGRFEVSPFQDTRQASQGDGRVRHWIYVEELGKYLRVVTLEDGETVHNAFPDRHFRGAS